MNGTARTTLVDMLDQVAQRRADETAFVYLPDGDRETDSMTFGQLDQRARALGAWLVDRGLTGQRALLSTPPGTDFVVALAGCFLANVTAVPVVPETSGRHRRQRLRHIIADCSPAVELTSTEVGVTPSEDQFGGDRDDALPCLLVDQVDVADATGFTPAPVTPDALAIIQYTSGSTTAPRGVMVSQRNVLANLAMLERLFEQPDGRPTVNWLPLHHDMGLFGNVLRSLYSGGRCVLMPPSAFLRRPLRWLQAIDRYGAFVSGAPNFAYDMCVRRVSEEERAGLDLSSWKVAFSGSEPVRAETLERFSEAFAPAGFAPSAFVPGYGLAEATLVVSGVARTDQPAVHDLSGEALRAGEVVKATGSAQDVTRQVSCGRPCPGVEVTLVDPATHRPVPVGRVGEIWLRGENIASGYWNRPEVSAEVFGARLASGPDGEPADGGQPYLRTGDLGALIDGELVVTGRIKDLIIVRGVNYYPQDIEYTVRDSVDPERAGVTAVFAEQRDSSEGVVVVQEVRPSGLDLREVCDEIQKRVMVDHGLPVSRVALVRPGQVPRTSSGKVQRARCRQLLTEGRLIVVYDDIPDSDAESSTGIDLLATDRPAMDESFVDDFRAMVGLVVSRPPESISPDEPLSVARVDSLYGAELQERLHQRFGIEVELTTLLGRQTLREVAETIHAATIDRTGAGRRQEAMSALPAEPVVSGTPLDPFPLTALQEAYLAGRSPGFELGGVGTHVYLEYQHDNLDVPRIVDAWQRTVRRHAMLRAVVTPEGEQRILPEVAEPIHVDDHREQPDAEEWVRRTRARMSHQVLDPFTGPLFEIRLSRLPGDRSVIHISLDLLIVDASGLLTVLREWGRHYAGTGDTGPVAGPSFRTFLLRHRDRAAGQLAERAQGGLTRLHPGPGLPLAVDPATIGTPTFRHRSARLAPEVWHRLERAAQARGVTRAALLGAAFSEVLARYSDQRPFTLTVTSFTRPTGQVGPEVIGEFTTLLLVPVQDRVPDFDTRLRDFSHELASALQNRDVDGVALLRERIRASEPGRAPRPLAPVVFTCLTGDASDLDWLGEQRYAISQTPQVWLDHQVVFTRGGPELIWDAVEELFPPGLLDAMFATYQRLLRTLSERESWRVDGGELAGLVRLAGRTASAALHGSDQTLDQLVEAQIERTPDSEAVVAGGRRVSYRELGNASRLVAARLLDSGMRPGDPAIIALPKGWEQIAAVLGTLRAGGVYLPVDPDVTDARMRHLVADSTARFVLTSAALAASRSWVDATRCLPVDELWPDGLDQPVPGPPRVDRQPDDLAYLIYTSGSTGQPKGVAIEHRGAANTVLDINDRFRVGPADRILGVTPLTFDLSVYDIFGPLSAGARLVLPDHERRGEPDHWVELLRREGVTLWNSVPALLRLLVEDPAAADLRWAERLRLLLLSGDWIGVDFAAQLRRDLPRARLISLGGATEGSIWSVSYEIDQVDPAWRSVPYGTALRGQDAVVLDDQLEPRPSLVPGPLYLSGVGLAREYWRDPERTAASFVVHPGTGRRLYRTGDLATLRPDGNLELLGREDTQLKVQGHRIEPGEVEAALASHPGVIGAVVGAVGPRDGVRRLVGYVRLHPGQAVTPAELRDHVAGLLPRYLVPDSVRMVDAFPLTANGKLDRQALFDAAEAARADPAPGTLVEPAGAADDPAVRAAVLRTVAMVAGQAEVVAGTRFTELEFTSVHLIRLANALEAEFGVRPRLDSLYQMSTVDDLVRYHLASSHPRPAEPAAEQTPGASDAPAPLTGPGSAGNRAAGPVLVDPAERDAFKRRHRSRPAPVGDGLVISLPGADDPTDRELLERRTANAFAADPTGVADLAAWLGCLRERVVDGRARHAWGSAGGIYPVEVYLQVNERGVRGLAPGVYYYDLRAHTLSLLAGEMLVRPDHHGADNRRLHEQAAVAVFLVADLDAITPLYGELAERFCLIEAGSMGQLLEMRAPRHGLGTRAIGVLDFSTAAAELGLRAGQQLVHSLLGGRSPAVGPAAMPAGSGATAAGSGSTASGSGPTAMGDGELDRPYRALPVASLRGEVEAQVGLRSHHPAPATTRPHRAEPTSAVLVTGATGFLGAHLVSALLRRTDATVYGLVRAPHADGAAQRLHQALHRYGCRVEPDAARRLVGIAGDLSQNRLGLSTEEYDRLGSTVDTVLHSGAEVSWARSYRRVAEVNVAGTRRIIDFAADRPDRSLVHVSTVAVFPFGGSQPIMEATPLDHDGLLYGGYSQSKWVAEQVVRQAADEGLDVTVLRPGTIMGDSTTGAFNPVAFLDLFLIACVQLGWVPELDMPLDMTPVDYAAAAAVALTVRPDRGPGPYHLTHPAPLRLTEVYDLVEAFGYPLRREPFDSWRDRLLAPEVIAAAGLAPFARYLGEAREDFLRMPPYDSSGTLAALPDDVGCPPMDQRLISTYLSAYVRSGYLRTPRRS